MRKIIKTLRGLLWFIVLGIIIGILSVIFDISPTSPIPIITIVVVVFGYYFYVFRKDWLLPIRFINNGRYDEAIEMMTKVEDKNKGTIGYRRLALYNIAVCYTLKGEFQRSIDILDQLKHEKMDKNLKAAFLSAYASSLIALDRNMDLAEEYVDEASKIRNLPSNMITKAHFCLTKGDEQAAEHLVQQALLQAKPKKVTLGFSSAILIDPALNELTENYSLGTFYYRTNNMDKAQYYLSKASEYKYENYYTVKANELLQEMCIT